MKESDIIVVRGEGYHIDEFLDENGKHDLPSPIDAGTLGVTERTIRNYRRETGGDYHELSFYLVNKCPRTQQISAWQHAFALWKKRQGFDF